MKKGILPIVLYFMVFSVHAEQVFNLTSKDQQTVLTVEVGEEISWSVKKYGQNVIKKAVIGLEIENQKLGWNSKLKDYHENEMEETLAPVVPLKQSKVNNSYKSLELKFEDRFSIQFRVYNEGVAYRFLTQIPNEINVHAERMDLTFPEGSHSFFPQEEGMYSHYEREYFKMDIDEIENGAFCSLPVMFGKEEEFKVLFSEADLYDYPNLFLKKGEGQAFQAIFPKVVLETQPKPSEEDRSVNITKEANYIAATQGERSFPWRFFMIDKEDKAFLENDMVFKLSRPLKLEKTDWIKPGKVAWDWYNANNIFGVDFESGLNTVTYKYYIDFAAQYGLEYVILDEGWTKSTTEITEFNPEMDVHEIIAYGKEKGVGIILWCLWVPLDADLENILQTYSDWGAKGIKVDFMQRADQYMVNSYTKIAREAGKRNLLVDYHGAFKPSGLRRAYPNVVSYEGVKGSENHKWGKLVTPEHNLTLPFIRMAVGPMDYTPGAMSNAQKENFTPRFERPMSQGTRAHQAAMYVLYESPLQMLCDSPSAYLKDSQTVEVIAQIPTVWDETIALDGKVGEMAQMVRRNGENWYLGAMTNWDARDLNFDFSFLPEGTYELTLLRDGKNAHRYAEDYVVEKMEVGPDSQLEVHLAPGGGCVGILKKK
ncbi:glycoside hydrolase family 97 protein [Echinicola jeungdonensis]|uniref:Glycoside hydrolase family 97 protein n=1 Tax=Echinicola jeungdonensis TaxID=709343 RepID=A0ABV5J4D2_9BACT|nr:glycoside hydrolase family 97 protein [Echinicola jeungdonensis]MDN3667895.1 glycoside hydrolase family 97 protein [Echinicola jeungdonensis]